MDLSPFCAIGTSALLIGLMWLPSTAYACVSLADALRLLDERLEAESPNLVTTVRMIDILIALFAYFYAGLPHPVRRKRYRNR
jgi:hypothetical protein